MFDNWLDMSLVIIERTFQLNSVDCDLMDVRGDLSISLAAFGGNLTVMTAITSSVFTVTDGTSIQYFDTGRAMHRIMKKPKKGEVFRLKFVYIPKLSCGTKAVISSKCG